MTAASKQNVMFNDPGIIESTDNATTNNPMPHVIPEGDNAMALEVIGATASDKLVIIMCGIPGGGKTGVAKRICRYLNFFFDLPAQIFNVADYRRELYGEHQPASFFDPQNADGLKRRNMAHEAALADLSDYMSQDGVRVAVYDASNSTKDQRKMLVDVLDKAGIGAKKMFLEIICDDPELLESNIRTLKKTPEYKDVDEEEAIRDYMERRRIYSEVYETIDESEGSYMKVFDCKKFVVHNIRGYLPLKVVHFMMNLHTCQRKFYFTRHGQSEYNKLGKIGGDSGLSNAGLEYARRLANFAEETITKKSTVDEDGNTVRTDIAARMWTSTLRRTKETAQFIKHPSMLYQTDDDSENDQDWVQLRPQAWRNLDELYAGAYDGMTYKEIEAQFPEEFKRRQSDKLAYRYPRGESYMDVILRLEPLAHEMERTREPILIIGHQGILRILYAYFMGLTREEAPYVRIPLNTIIEISPHAYGCRSQQICLMRKEEMMVDGQDEPVTSMPVSDKLDQFRSSLNQLTPGNDPVMDAPSC